MPVGLFVLVGSGGGRGAACLGMSEFPCGETRMSGTRIGQELNINQRNASLVPGDGKSSIDSRCEINNVFVGKISQASLPPRVVQNLHLAMCTGYM